MLFERFISKERNEPPDIDVDFEHERREEVIQYVYEKYGRERAAMAADGHHLSAAAARSATSARPWGCARTRRSAGRSRRRTGTTGKRSATASPAQGLHLDADVHAAPVPLVKELLDFPRHLSQHVGGMVIAEAARELVPIENAAMPERTVIQWDKNDLDALGILKVDLLALGMLTAIRKTFDLLAATRLPARPHGPDPAEDPEVYDMICRADTIGVFQIESGRR